MAKLKLSLAKKTTFKNFPNIKALTRVFEFFLRLAASIFSGDEQAAQNLVGNLAEIVGCEWLLKKPDGARVVPKFD